MTASQPRGVSCSRRRRELPAGVVDQHVDAAEALEHAADEARPPTPARGCRRAGRSTSPSDDSSRDRRARGARACGCAMATRAPSCEQLGGGGAADAGAAAGDDGGAALHEARGERVLTRFFDGKHARTIAQLTGGSACSAGA